MRNFSKVVHIHHFSYAINQGEYVNEVDVMSVLRDLAKAFEAPLASVIHDFQCITSGFKDSQTLLCPSEVDVLTDLYDFMHYANSGVVRYQDIQRAFVYINLNTGVSVVWAHAIT